jgi:hypothetical protein
MCSISFSSQYAEALGTQVRMLVSVDSCQTGQHGPLAAGEFTPVGGQPGQSIEESETRSLIALDRPRLPELIHQAAGMQPRLTQELFKLALIGPLLRQSPNPVELFREPLPCRHDETPELLELKRLRVMAIGIQPARTRCLARSHTFPLDHPVGADQADYERHDGRRPKPR